MYSSNLQGGLYGLHLEGYSDPSNILLGGDPVNLNALAFQISVPEKYLSLLAGMREPQSLRSLFQKANKQDNQVEALVQTLTARQQYEIDSNILTLRVNGMDVDIEQGELRELMEERLEELKERRKQLLENGASREEIEALDDLIEAYREGTDEMRQVKADHDTMDKIDSIMTKDLEFRERIEGKFGISPQNNIFMGRKATSFAAELDEPSHGRQSLTAAFEKGGTFDPSSTPEPDLPPPHKVDKNLDSALESFGF